ncbi:hypothetical protein MLDJOKPK_00162 [Salmonella phage SPAsTU]|nr:hypothetical protein MLDJOKPK_00162 [Salmonella phage SPAsTU]
MNRPNAVSAIEGMHQDGFTIEEATRIRPFLPRRFYPFPSMFRTNIHAWEAIRAVEDALQYNNFEFKFTHKWTNGEPLDHFHFQMNDFMEYRSPTYHTRFLSIEFVRHYGDALFTERSEDPEAGRRLVQTNGGLRIKMNRLREIHRLITTGEQQQHIYRDFNVTPFMLPTDVNSVGKAVTALRAGWAEWFNINNPFGEGTWTRFNIPTDPTDRCMWQTLYKQLHPEELDLDATISRLPIYTNVHYWPFSWLPGVRLPDGTVVTYVKELSGWKEVYGLKNPETGPTVSYYPNGHQGWALLLNVPEDVYNLFPREEWLTIFG